MLEASQLAIRCQSRRNSVFHKFSVVSAGPGLIFWIPAVQNRSSHIRVGTGLLSWCQITEQIEKKWASPGVIKLFDIFIWLRATGTFPPLCLPPLPQRVLLMVLLVSRHAWLLPMYTPTSEDSPNHSSFPAPSLQILWASFSIAASPGIGNFLFSLCDLRRSLCHRICILWDRKHHGGSKPAVATVKVIL